MRFFISCFGTANTAETLVSQPSRRPKRDASHWRPSLRSISEDTAPPRRDTATAPSAADVKRRNSTSTGPAKVDRRQSSDHYDGRVDMPAIMPAFSPTPFIF